MPTSNFNLPLIDGASPISIVNDLNSLATATDSAMSTLATQGDISSVKQIANNANTQSTAAYTEAESATSKAEAANSAAVTAQQSAASANSAATNAANQAKSALEKANQVEAHTYFVAMTEHPSSPWAGKGSITGRQSNDGQRIEINGTPLVNTTGSGSYTTKAAVSRAITNTPRGVQGIPILQSSYKPSAVQVKAGVGIMFFTDSSSEAFNFANAYTCDVWLDVDGIVYLNIMDYQNHDYAYGFLSSGPFSVA